MFSFIGFTTQEVAVNQRTSINVKLESANTALNEVVVTALGIKRQSKSLRLCNYKCFGRRIDC